MKKEILMCKRKISLITGMISWRRRSKSILGRGMRWWSYRTLIGISSQNLLITEQDFISIATHSTTLQSKHNFLIQTTSIKILRISIKPQLPLTIMDLNQFPIQISLGMNMMATSATHKILTLFLKMKSHLTHESSILRKKTYAKGLTADIQ